MRVRGGKERQEKERETMMSGDGETKSNGGDKDRKKRNGVLTRRTLYTLCCSLKVCVLSRWTVKRLCAALWTVLTNRTDHLGGQPRPQWAVITWKQETVKNNTLEVIISVDR